MNVAARPDVANSELINELFYALDALGSLGSVVNDSSLIFIFAGGGFLTVGLSPKPGQEAIAVKFPSTAQGISGCIFASFRRLFRKIHHQILLIEQIEQSDRDSDYKALRIQSVNYDPLFDYKLRLMPIAWAIYSDNVTLINSPNLQDLNIMRNAKIVTTNNYHDDLKLAREYDIDLPGVKMPKKSDLYDAIASYNATIEAQSLESDRALLQELPSDPIETARANLLASWTITPSEPIALVDMIPATVTKAKPKPVATVPPLTEPVSVAIAADPEITEPATTVDPYRDLFSQWKNRAAASPKATAPKVEREGIAIGQRITELLENNSEEEVATIVDKPVAYVKRAAGAYWIYLNCQQVRDLHDTGKASWACIYKASCANPEKKQLSITAKVIERSRA